MVQGCENVKPALRRAPQVSYRNADPRTVMQEPGTLAVFGFGAGADGSDDPRWLRVDLESFDAPAPLEIWQVDGPVAHGREGDVQWASGDGWLFRGAGLISLTFRDNHAKCGRYFGIPVEKVGEWLRTPEGACRSAAWFWKTHGCNELADKDDIDGVSDAINLGHQTDKYGDAIGFADRLAFRLVAARVIE